MANVILGPVPGVEVGQHFSGRRELHDADVHRGLMKGIAPAGSSIVLSGGYVDDEDYGDDLIYTGEGGNDLATKRQIADQTLTGGNLALARNCDEGVLVRVNRGSKLDSAFAPSTGYRYDGLYRIESYWQERGQDGYIIWRYKLERHEEGQPSLQGPEQIGIQPEGSQTPGREQITMSRVVRSTAIGNEVKRLHNFTCQRCGVRLTTPAGAYAECCHIRPLGRPHNGPDTLDNVLCLCANCHVLFDKKALLVADDLTIVGESQQLHQVSGHEINTEHLAYHRSLAGG